MIRRLVPIVLPGLLLVPGCVPVPPPSTPKRVAAEIGCIAPELEGTDLEGHKYKLSDYRGKVVVVDFWATWCPPCRRMIPQEKELVERMQGRPFAFLAVSEDESREALSKFLESDAHGWPVLHDQTKMLSLEWRVNNLPTFVFIDANGVIRDRIEGGGPELFGKRVEPLMQEVEAR
jgi:thiol-disulfide isomerase/thioredoxin